ncbi:MAG: hypothetical protein H0X62_02025 [Bacteroidetes bacterium]|nr:hypothetical protein [Bacteroidota bacterium]
MKIYLEDCITRNIISNDKVKEFLMASNVEAVRSRLQKKLDTNFFQRKNLMKKHTIKVSDQEAVSLYLYFNRYNFPLFLLNSKSR